MADPFCLEWRNVNVTVKLKKNKTKQILFNQQGVAHSGEVVAIIGASGSGKTTLMNYLSGFIGPEFTTKGSITFGSNKEVSNKVVRGVSGYVLQEDILQTQLTVYENIEYSARFKLRKLTSKSLKSKVTNAIQMLNLEKCKNTRIGTEFQRGVSGGEKKRCCIGMELVNEPPILFLDEPTTGLDSVNAEDVVLCMKELAKMNKIVISTIHQPSVDLLKMFDKIIIMHEGMAIYSGKYDHMSGYYADHGVTIPNYVNQVEYILTCLNMNESNCKLLAETASDVKTNYFEYSLVEAVKNACLEAKKNTKADPIVTTTKDETVQALIKSASLEKNGFWSSLWVQTSRTWLTFFRDKRTFGAQIIVNAFYVVLALILFRDLGTDLAGIQNRNGVLYYLMMVMIFSMLQISSMAFSTGFTVLKKELMQGMYTPASYFIGVTVPPDLPTLIIMSCSSIGIFFISNLNFVNMNKLWNFLLLMIGSIQAGEGFGHVLAAIFSDPSKTVAAIPIILMPLQLFSGFLFDLDSIPEILKPISWISIFRYSLEGLVLNEFNDLDCVQDCSKEATSKGYHSTVQRSIIMLFAIAMGSRVLSLLIFHLKYKKYYDL